MSEIPPNYLMNIASLLFFLCYIPEAYANIRNKNANAYNIPEKIIMLCGTGFALSYAITIKDTSLMLNYAPLMSLDCIMLSIRIYYAYFYKEDVESNGSNWRKEKMLGIQQDLQCTMIEHNEIPNPIHNIESTSSFESHSSDDYL